ncbi:MAG: hypothetical protein CFE31_06880 [Rhizobiales bacterium PAR1]|nr:MAG: hypothetical protein CFE31_06880 [Rhizobiales bacterium PAR1]
MSIPVSFLRSAALAALLMAGVGSAFAQQPAAPAPTAPTGPSVEEIMKTPFLPSHLAVANDVLKASGMRTMFENSMPNVVGALRVNVTRQRPELAKVIEECLAIVEKESGNVMNEGVTSAARFLAVRMSEAELKDVNTFLNTPSGKKYVEILPLFMDQVMPFIEIWSEESGARLSKIFQDEMAKRGHKL